MGDKAKTPGHTTSSPAAFAVSEPQKESKTGQETESG
jgi:hypothetical protein